MARNIEIKAKVKDVERLRALIEKLPVISRETFFQEDTFFRISTGRLKFRRLGPDRGQLIYYDRADSKGPKISEYSILETNQPDIVNRSLSKCREILGVVRKKRDVYIVGQTRIHVDEVEGLGKFVEFEFVFEEGQDVQEGKKTIAQLMVILGIEEDSLLGGAYIDLQLLTNHFEREFL